MIVGFDLGGLNLCFLNGYSLGEGVFGFEDPFPEFKLDLLKPVKNHVQNKEALQFVRSPNF